MAVRSGEPSNPHLLQAMRDVALSDNAATRHGVYEALLTSILLVPVANRPAFPGWKTLQNDTTMEFITTQRPDGQTALLAFSDSTALQKWKPAGSGFVGIQAKTLFALAGQNGFNAIIVNIAGPTGGEITRGELDLLAQGRIPGETEAA
jgi:SseB protein N-terminal domain